MSYIAYAVAKTEEMTKMVIMFGIFVTKFWCFTSDYRTIHVLIDQHSL